MKSEENKGFDGFLKKWEEFESTHTKRSKEEMFSFFETHIKKKLLDFVNFTEMKLMIEKTDEAITVKLSDVGCILLSCDEDKSLLKIMNTANAVFIKKNDKNIELELWFRGWEWEENSGVSDSF